MTADNRASLEQAHRRLMVLLGNPAVFYKVKAFALDYNALNQQPHEANHQS
jgi:hypothetical protein